MLKNSTLAAALADSLFVCYTEQSAANKLATFFQKRGQPQGEYDV